MAIIYDNTASATVFFDPPGTFGDPVFGLSNSFSTGAGPTGLSLINVAITLSGPTPAVPGSGGLTIVRLLASTAAPAPGAVIAQLGIVYDANLTDVYQLFQFPAAQVLAANTRYWISLIDGSQAGFGVTNSQWGVAQYDGTQLGLAGQYFANESGVIANAVLAAPDINGSPYQMQITTV
jgi:hypothetical protein